MHLGNTLTAPPGRSLALSDWDPGATPRVDGKPDAARRLADNLEALARLQYRLYAENRRSLLVVLQAMDTGGKDGVIRHVMTGLNPQGCRVTPFTEPTRAELAHDYLWRVHQAVPPRGEIGVFNRSHYEDVLVVRVRGLVPAAVWRQRYEQINAFERHLDANGVAIVKCFLHISKAEQKRRLDARRRDPEKRWKLAPGDAADRRRWEDYQQAYETALSRCSTPWAPWFIVPADHKWYRNFAVSQLLRERLEALRIRFPKAAPGAGC